MGGIPHRSAADIPDDWRIEHLGTQAEVAAMLGVNRVTVAKRENGTMTITNEAVLAIQSFNKLHKVRYNNSALA